MNEKSNQIEMVSTNDLYLTFNLAGQPYGTQVSNVLEINQLIDITPVPKVPAFVKGVMNLRGKVVPVVDLRLKFGTKQTPTTKQTSIIVIDGTSGQIGVIVDSVQSVIHFEKGEIETPPQFGGGQSESSCIGLGKHNNGIVILVNLVMALSKEHFHQPLDLNLLSLTGQESPDIHH